MDRDERDLVRRCLEGDQEACAALVDSYAPMVGTVIWRATGQHAVVEDLAQETFLRVFRGLGYFDGRAKLSTWIYTIAHRVAVDHGRQADRHREVLTDVPPPGSDPEATAAREEMDQIVRVQLAQLPEKYRWPLVYAAIDGLDYATIGSMLGVRAGTVKTLVFRGKEMLRERVEACGLTPLKTR